MIRRPFTDHAPDAMPMPGLNPYVAEHASFGREILPATEALSWKDRWSEWFGRTAPLHLEIGSGNGFYLSGMAGQHPEADWVGLEIRYKRVVLAARKLRGLGLTNACVVRFDATHLHQLFPVGSLAGVHINHPDPWARDKQAKHRLIGREFLELLAPLMQPGAELRLKTDFPPHITALLEAAPGLFTMKAVHGDVLAEGAPWPDDVRTNYQRKADEKGVAVGAVWLVRD